MAGAKRRFFSLETLRVVLIVPLLTMIGLEVLLRLYNPLHTRLHGERIVLPAHLVEVRRNDEPGLDPAVRRETNALGFYGPDYPKDPSHSTKIIAIGGSSTLCPEVNEEHTWVHLLGEQMKASCPSLWINNAGVTGHSTFAHALLLSEHVVPLHPDYALFLVGGNDVHRDDLNSFDRSSVRSGAKAWLIDHSALLGFAANVRPDWVAKRHGLVSGYWSKARIEAMKQAYVEPDPVADAKVLAAEVPYVDRYRDRLRHMIRTAKDQGIVPILITTPTVVGDAIDPATGLDLSRVKLDVEVFQRGGLWAGALELYNQATRDTGRDQGVAVIDLAAKMEKSTALFADFVHFRRAGNERVAEIIADGLRDIVRCRASQP